MEIKNYDKFMTDEGRAYVNPNRLMPQHPCRLLIIGPSGSGKTNALLNLLCNEDGMYYDKLYVYAPTVHEEPKYTWLQDYIKTIEHRVSKKKGMDIEIGTFSADLGDLVDVDDLDENTQNIIVFDDMTTKGPKQHEKICEHFIRGRKKNTSYIYLGHGWREVPPLMRKNSTDIILFPIDDKNQMRELAKTKATRINFQEFMKVLNEVNEGGGFLYLSLRETKLPMWIRRGFDELYVPDK